MKRPKSMLPFGKGFKRGVVQLATSEEKFLTHLGLLAQLIFYPVLYAAYYLFFNIFGDDNGQIQR